MAKNEFLPFGIADGASVLTNEEYGNLAAHGLTGLVLVWLSRRS